MCIKKKILLLAHKATEPVLLIQALIVTYHFNLKYGCIFYRKKIKINSLKHGMIVSEIQ